MISKETAAKIYNAYAEIERANKLLDYLKESKTNPDWPTIEQGSDRQKGLQLGIPTDYASHRLIDVRPELGLRVIEEHIVHQNKLLEDLMEKARLELLEKELLPNG